MPNAGKCSHLSESLVGAGTVVVGDIAFSGGLRVDGRVIGNVRALDGQRATLVIGETGCVEGNIEVTDLVVHGAVTGRVRVTALVELRFKAQVGCDIEYSAIEIHAGAVIQGRLLHCPQDVQVDKLLRAAS